MLLHGLHVDDLGHAVLEQDRLLIVEASVPNPHIVIACRCVEAEDTSFSCADIAPVQVYIKGTNSRVSDGHWHAAGYRRSYSSRRDHSWVKRGGRI